MTTFFKFGLLTICILTISCNNTAQTPIESVKLPKKIKESSGIAVSKDGKTAWLIQDKGNAPKLYAVSRKGKLKKTYDILNAKNNDWEDLAQDYNGNLYIGDFGNNENKRKDLCIYKIPEPTATTGENITAEKISFYYPQQKKFPPKSKELLFDAEAFFYKNDFLYIITKNRSKPFSAKALIYKVPAKAGHYKATLIGSFKTCMDKNSCKITAADISPDGTKIALLGPGTLWIFSNVTTEDFTTAELKVTHLNRLTQTEAVSFIDEQTVLVTDEENAHTGRKLYTYKIAD